MTNKRKKLARALSEKTGMSHQAAINVLSPPQALPAPRVERSIPQLLAALRAPSALSVVAGRCPAVGRSASLDKAVAQAEALANAPLYFAESLDVSLIVTSNESHALLDAGAAPHGLVQVIHAFRIGKDHTVSNQCDSCRAWIWCFQHDDEQHAEGVCDCGHHYRIVFDGRPDWSRGLDARCMRCGTEHRLSERRENLNPWRVVNERQLRCNRCESGDQKAELSELFLRSKMIAADPPSDDPSVRHNGEVGRFHTELSDLIHDADTGKVVPEDVLRRVRDEGARLDEQRRRLLGPWGS